MAMDGVARRRENVIYWLRPRDDGRAVPQPHVSNPRPVRRQIPQPTTPLCCFVWAVSLTGHRRIVFTKAFNVKLRLGL
jgi:hypothetical protein